MFRWLGHGGYLSNPKATIKWEIIGDGHGVHWPDIDEDISAEGMLSRYSRAEAESVLHAPFKIGREGGKGYQGHPPDRPYCELPMMPSVSERKIWVDGGK